MNPAAIPVPDPNESAAPVAETPVVPTDETAHPDPITGEPGAHPVGVGVGALGAGMAGAAIGALGGPIGMLIGAAVGAVAGGLAGHEVAASTPETAATTEEPAATDESAFPGEPVTALETPGVLGANVPGFGAAALAAQAAHGGFGGGSVSHGPSTSEYDTEVEVESDVPLEGDSSRETGSYFTATGATGLEAPRAVEEGDLVAPVRSGDEHAVRLTAYYHYLDRRDTGEPGDALSDWLAAEREVLV